MSAWRPDVFWNRTGEPDPAENKRRGLASRTADQRLSDPYRTMNMLDVQEYFSAPEHQDVGFDMHRFEWDSGLKDRVDRILSEKLLKAEAVEKPDPLQIRRLRGLILAATIFPVPYIEHEDAEKARGPLREQLAKAMKKAEAKRAVLEDAESEKQAFNHLTRLMNLLDRTENINSSPENEILDELATRFLEQELADKRYFLDYRGEKAGRSRIAPDIKQLQDIRTAVYARLLGRIRGKKATARPPGQSLRNPGGKAAKPGP